jgi:hypothetical protein
MEAIIKTTIDRTILVGILVLHAFFAESQEYLQKSHKKREALMSTGVETELLDEESGSLFCNRGWYVPTQYKLQYAGGIGFMSAGFGYDVSNSYKPALFIGYLSESFGGSKSRVLSISVKNSFHFTRKPVLNHFMPYGGLSINWGNTNNTFRYLPEYYPDEYYFQNKVHFAPFLGTELYFDWKNKRPFKGVGFYAELSAMDAYLLEAIRTDYVKLHMAMSLALGVTFYLD